MPDPQKPKLALIPARYVGHQPVKLRPGVRYRNADGKLLDSLILTPGDTLMIPETELRGQTFLVDPSGLTGDAQWLGVGDTRLPEHAGVARADLIGVPFMRDGRVRQYEFHEGRSDFQEVDAPWPPVSPEGTPEGTPEVSRKPSRRAPDVVSPEGGAVDGAQGA